VLLKFRTKPQWWMEIQERLLMNKKFGKGGLAEMAG